MFHRIHLVCDVSTKSIHEPSSFATTNQFQGKQKNGKINAHIDTLRALVSTASIRLLSGERDLLARETILIVIDFSEQIEISS